MVVVDDEAFRRLPGTIAIARAGLALARGDVPATVTYAQQALDLRRTGIAYVSQQVLALLEYLTDIFGHRLLTATRVRAVDADEGLKMLQRFSLNSLPVQWRCLRKYRCRTGSNDKDAACEISKMCHGVLQVWHGLSDDVKLGDSAVPWL
jgi:hypothetical protein